MPIPHKLKDIYMSKSLDQLNKKAEDIPVKPKLEGVITPNDIERHINSADKIYVEAKKALINGDEERAYVLFYRFFHIFQSFLKAKIEKKYLTSMGVDRAEQAMGELEKLGSSLEKRYEILSESEKLRAKEISESNELNNDCDDKNGIQSKSNDLNEVSTIDCINLYQCIENSTEITKILIMDTRPENEFNESHIDPTRLKPTGDITVANIPEHILIPGMTAKKIEEKLLFGQTKDAFTRRRTMNKVIIVDAFSREWIPNTPAFNLAESLKWDGDSLRIKCTPLLLEGGYEQWVLTFPQFTSNPVLKNRHNMTPKKMNLIINYNFEEEENEQKVSKNIVNGLTNGVSENDSIIESQPKSEVKDMFIPRPTNTAIPGTALPLIPDRSMKPKLQTEGKSTNQSNMKTEIPVDFDKIKLRKQAEASEAMLSSVQEDFAETCNGLIKQIKQKDEENNALISQLRNIKPENKPTTDSKPKINISINGDIVGSEKRNGIYVNNDLKLNEESNLRPKPGSQTPVNGYMNDSIESNKSAPTPTKNLLTVNNNSNLSRSISSPNIAQLIAKENLNEEYIESNDLMIRSNNNVTQPKFDRTLKPANRDQFNDIVNEIKLRDFSPVFSTVGAITGLRNLGNTCFMNAVLQCLLNTPEFAFFFNGKFYINRSAKFGSNGELAIELTALFRAMAYPSQYKFISPKDFKLTVSRHISGFIGCNQQDSHEFLVKLLEQLHADLNESNNNSKIDISILEDLAPTVAANRFWKEHVSRNQSIFTTLFEGLLIHTLICLTCKKSSNTFEVFSHLSIPLTNTRTSLYDCMKLFFKTERMSGEAAWDCPTCKQKREADKRLSIHRLPKVLLVHLKRFSYEGVWRQKLQTYVDFPIEEFNIQQHNTASTVSYKLYGVVNHYGTLEGGHYTAFSRNEKYDWHRFDDQEVIQISSADVKTQAAYILFYKLCKS